MKIGMMSAWNTDSGVAIHAELIGREWVKQGHELEVFSFIREDFHGDGFTSDVDEKYVVRCFGTSTKTNFLDPRPILRDSYDVFVVQDLRMLPYRALFDIYPLLRRKAKIIVHVLHECTLPIETWFYMFDWDAVIYFDNRQSLIEEIYPNSYLIPFPCAPWRTGDQEEARRALNLPIDKKIILIFAQRGYHPYFPDLPDEIRDKVLLLVLARREEDILEAYTGNSNIEVRFESVLSWRRLDLYALASDGIVLHKFKSRGYAVVSSTAFQLLGAGRPLFIPRYSDFFHPLYNEVLRYGNPVELGSLIAKVVEGDVEVERVIENAWSYVEKNSAEKIAEEYIRLFEKLIQR